MANIETIELDGLNFAEVAAPATPSAASVIVYAKSDGKLYLKDDAGTETDLTATGAGGVTFAGAWAKKTASFPTLTNDTDATLAFDAADDYDTDAFHDPATNNSRMTIPLAFNGKKGRFTAMVSFAANATGRRRVCLKKNGSLFLCTAVEAVSGAQETQMIVVFPPVALATADYFEIAARQNSGGNLATTDQQFIMEIVAGS